VVAKGPALDFPFEMQFNKVEEEANLSSGVAINTKTCFYKDPALAALTVGELHKPRT